MKTQRNYLKNVRHCVPNFPNKRCGCWCVISEGTGMSPQVVKTALKVQVDKLSLEAAEKDEHFRTHLKEAS